jgi:sugar diacid utilization regulator
MFTRQGIKVGEVYEFLKEGRARLTAGKSGLCREVRSVSVTKTALEIYTHPNTIKYRLKRIEEIMGENIFKNKTEIILPYVG